ncbi:hypothetical protein D9758_011875 [Tetrapyrgos nigripes]|uniref:Cytochrome P450 n=1 Tax=Tetrapyrgos nigripes TaxID=182062 RepID=A0A8H5FQC8_9AGAR|nr:hypothetical protein D9758_011875 [Tetrapyrgos nigripes]
MPGNYISNILALLVSIFILKRLAQYRRRLPPGPPAYPIIGNVLDIPSEGEWIKYRDMSREYGSDVIHLNMCGTPLIVLNSLETATELLHKRSSNYSDRPRFTMLNELVGFTWHLAFMPYGKEWRKARKVFHQELNPRALLQYRPVMVSATQKLLVLLLEKPEDFLNHLRFMAGTTILSMAYSIDAQAENDPYVKIAEESLHAMACTANAGSYLVDQIPILKHVPNWFPGSGFKAQAKQWNKVVSAMPVITFDSVKQAMTKGNFVPSIASRSLERLASESSTNIDHLEAERVLKGVLASMYAAGSDTTVSALGTFILALVRNPEVQKKGQMAIDEVVGLDRLPDFSDFGSIPYLDAILREVLRWIPVTPLSIPYRSIEDDEYKGYYIPAGATVVGNSWAILHDESIYGPNTHLFNPERFLKDGFLDASVAFPDAAFGFGKRQCPGNEMALSSIWIAITCILACFDVTKAVDEDGKVVEPSGEYTSGMLGYPLPFKCSIKPRSQRVKEMIHSLRELHAM